LKISDPGTSFQFFPRGGKILTDFLGEGGGAKYEKNKILCAKTQINHYFQNQGGKHSPLAPPQMTSLIRPTRLPNKRYNRPTRLPNHKDIRPASLPNQRED